MQQYFTYNFEHSTKIQTNNAVVRQMRLYCHHIIGYAYK